MILKGRDRMRTNELMLYKNMEYGELLKDMTFLMDNHGNEYYNREDLRSLLFECINRLLELSVSHGFEGNLWHTYLTFLLVNDENAYSTSCEITGGTEVSMRSRFMTLKFSKNCSTMISQQWKAISGQAACRSSWIIKTAAIVEKSLTGASGTGSVTWRKDLAAHQIQQIFSGR